MASSSGLVQWHHHQVWSNGIIIRSSPMASLSGLVDLTLQFPLRFISSNSLDDTCKAASVCETQTPQIRLIPIAPHRVHSSVKRERECELVQWCQGRDAEGHHTNIPRQSSRQTHRIGCSHRPRAQVCGECRLMRAIHTCRCVSSEIENCLLTCDAASR